MKDRPVIMVSPDFGFDPVTHVPRILLQKAYPRAISAAGGLPLIPTDIYQLKDYAGMADGLLLCGGQGPHPRLYNEDFDDPDAPKTVNVTRDEFEMAAIGAFIAAGKPVMGICRGHQMLNIYFGGSLVQNFPAKGHPNHHYGTCHSVKADADSVLGRLIGTDIKVNSYHKNAIGRLAEGLKITAYSDDGIPEAMEHLSLPVFGTQFHPERMRGEERTPALGPDMSPLFDYFLKLCGK